VDGPPPQQESLPNRAQRSRGQHRRPSVVIGIAVALAIVVVIGLIVMWPGPVQQGAESELLRRGQILEARFVLSEIGPCGGVEVPEGIGIEDVECRRTTFVIEQGPDSGTQVVIDFPDNVTSPEFQEGERVLLERPRRAQDEAPYGFYDRIRTPALFWLALIFAVVVVALGRLRGLGALVGLAISFFILMRFVIPAILAGGDPIAVALIGTAAIAFVVIYLAAGFSERTTVALLGTLSGLAAAFAIGAVWVPLTKLMGLGSEEAFVVSAIGIQVDFTGLFLAGIVIGALGAIDDVSVTQVASVWELKEAQPSAGPRALYRSAMRIGRDHIGSIVNTLVLAYAGASLPLLILITLSRDSASQTIGTEAIASEVLRTFAGSIGLILAMPITTWIAAHVATSGDRRGWRADGLVTRSS
jgi:uncharacterized membrane protein